MTAIRHILRISASALALVMITGVALPVAAQACAMLMIERPATMADCCPNGQQDTHPCHEAPEDDSADAPLPLPFEATVCCAGDDGVAFDEAILTEVKDSASTCLVSRAALEAEIPAQPRILLGADLDRGLESERSGTGLHILYGVMLN